MRKEQFYLQLAWIGYQQRMFEKLRAYCLCFEYMMAWTFFEADVHNTNGTDTLCSQFILQTYLSFQETRGGDLQRF